MNTLLATLNPFHSAGVVMPPSDAVAATTAHCPLAAAGTTTPGPAPCLHAGAETPAVAIDVHHVHPVAAADFSREHSSIPELFSAHARRRSLPIVSPPLPYHAVQSRHRFKPDMDALYREIVAGHPRDLDDPPPLFLRSPSPEFMAALIGLGGPTP